MAGKITLYMGNRSYSSWSLRAWWALKMASVEFDEVMVPLVGAGGTEERKQWTGLQEYSPAAKVPVLDDNGLLVWDSLAIMEYVAERYSPDVWPNDAAARAVARAVVADIHGGVPGLGTQVCFNCRREPIRMTPTVDAQRDIDRLCRVWNYAMERYSPAGSDGFLFGKLSLADVAASPILLILHGYGFDLPDKLAAYQQCVITHPAVQEWVEASKKESWVIEPYERIGA
jgi:glutathione S-transferase